MAYALLRWCCHATQTAEEVLCEINIANLEGKAVILADGVTQQLYEVLHEHRPLDCIGIAFVVFVQHGWSCRAACGCSIRAQQPLQLLQAQTIQGLGGTSARHLRIPLLLPRVARRRQTAPSGLLACPATCPDLDASSAPCRCLRSGSGAEWTGRCSKLKHRHSRRLGRCTRCTHPLQLPLLSLAQPL